MIRAGIYNRCSTDEEAQMNALEIQAAESREIVKTMGWVVARQYIETESGTTSYKRSEYQRMLEDMERDQFDVVVIKSIDRLMRSAKDWYIFIDKLTQKKKRLYIYIENKFYDPEDNLVAGIKAILAEDFSRELSKKIKNAHKRRQQKMSGWNITSPMFGWDKVGKNEFVINEEEAASYRLAFALAREGMGFHSIARMMYENGVRSKRGNRIDGTQWRNMIYANRAHGTMVMHTTEYDFETKKKIKLPQHKWIFADDALPAIVSKEYQEEVIRVLECRRQKKEGVKKVHIFSGKLYCGECGKVYYRVSFASGNNRLNEWKCSTLLHQGRKTAERQKGCGNISVLEECVFEKIGESCGMYLDHILGSREEIEAEALTMIYKIFRKKQSYHELEKVEKELDKLKKKKIILINKLADQVIDDMDFKNANQIISENVRKVQEKIDDIKSKAYEQSNYEKHLERIRNSLRDGVIERAKISELVNMIDKIVLYPDSKMEIIFNRTKMEGIVELQDENKQEERPENEFRIFAKYEHKTNTIRRREKINRQILMLFKENPDLKLKDISAITGMGESYVNTSVKELKAKELLRYERKGNTHTGRWIVNDVKLVLK